MCVSVVLSVLCAVIILFCNKNIAVVRCALPKFGEKRAACKLLMMDDVVSAVFIPSNG